MICRKLRRVRKLLGGPQWPEQLHFRTISLSSLAILEIRHGITIAVGGVIRSCINFGSSRDCFIRCPALSMTRGCFSVFDLDASVREVRESLLEIGGFGDA